MGSYLRALAAGRIAHLAAAALFTAVVLTLAWRYLSWNSFVASFSGIDFWQAIAALAVYVAVTAARAWRFLLAGARLSYGQAFGIAATHAALLRVMPLRSGELTYGILLKRFKGGGLGEGLASILMLRILDLAVLLSASGCVALLLPRYGAGMKAAAFALATLALSAIFFGLGPASLALKSRLSRIGSAPDGKIAKLADALVNAYALPLSRRLALVGATVFIWSLILFWLYLCALSVFPHIGPVDGIFAGALGAVGSVLPMSLIGSFGPMETGLALGLTTAGATNEAATSASLAASALTFADNWIVAGAFWAGAALRKSGVSRKISLATASFSIAGGLLLLVRIRYGFEINDQFQYLLLPYRDIYENFLPGDWFTWKTTHYHLFFSYLIRGLHSVLGESGLPWGVLAAHLLVLIGVAYGLVSLSRAAGWSWTAAADALLAVAFVRTSGMAGSLVNHGLLLPSDMALPAFLLGSAAWLRGSCLASGLWLGLGGLIHPNFAVLGILTIFPLEIWRAKRERCWIETVQLAGGYLFLAWPTLVFMTSEFLLSDTDTHALDIFFKIRSPHHYEPEIFTSSATWWIAALLAAGLPLWASRGANKPEWRVKALLAALISLQVAAGIGAAFDIGPIVRLFLWRLSVPLFLLGALAAGENLERSILSRRKAMVLYACCSLLIVAAFSTVSGSSSARIDRPNWRGALKRIGSFHPVRVVPTRARGVKGPLYEWIQNNTPKEAVFLAPPGMSDFRIKGRRSVFVDWKCSPVKGGEVLEWKRRMLLAMGTERFPAAGYALTKLADKLYMSRPLSALAYLARKERLSHIVARERGDAQTASAGLKKLITFEALSVYEAVPVHRIVPK